MSLRSPAPSADRGTKHQRQSQDEGGPLAGPAPQPCPSSVCAYASPQDRYSTQALRPRTPCWHLLSLERGTCHTSHLSYERGVVLQDRDERVRTAAYFDFHASVRNNSPIPGHATFFVAKLQFTVLQELDERAGITVGPLAE